MSAPPLEAAEATGAALTSAARRRRRPSPAFWLILPSILYMLFLFGYPLVEGVRGAFTDDSGFTLEHAQRMVGDPRFGDAVRNTLLLIVAVIPLQFLVALVMAFALRAKPRLSSLYFYLWAIPLAVSDLAAGLVWLSIFADQGYLNSVLVTLGLPSVSWLSYQNPTTMFIAVMVAEIWRATSLVLVIIVAGMQGIPKDYDEAAAVFGATFWQRVWGVTMPLLRPSLQVALILRTILAFQTFAVAQALTGEAFPLLVGETYRWYSVIHNPNVAAVYALVILGVSMLTAVIYLRLLRDQTTGIRS